MIIISSGLFSWSWDLLHTSYLVLDTQIVGLNPEIAEELNINFDM